MEPWPGATVGIAYALTGVSFFIIISRTTLRRLKHEDQLLDDYLMLGSIVFYAVASATNPVAYFHGTNFRIIRIPDEPLKLSQHDLQNAVLGSTYIMVGRLFYITYIWTLKACMTIFYTRIITDSHIEGICLKGTAVLLGITYFASICAVFLGCDPLQSYWQVLPDTPQCVQALPSVYVTGLSHILTNLILMLLPIPAIIRASFPFRSIMHVSTVFLLCIFVIIIVAVRIGIVLRGDPQWQAQELIWRQVDMFAMTVLVNKPILYRIWRHGFNHMRKGKFGVDACSTGYCPPVENQEARSESQPGKLSSITSNIKTSAQRLTDKARRSVGIQIGQIERTVELLQTSKTGNMNDENPLGRPPSTAEEHEDNAIFGGGSGPKAMIDTTVSRAGEIAADVNLRQQLAKRFSTLKRERVKTHDPSDSGT